jgi:hypothetical protein
VKKIILITLLFCNLYGMNGNDLQEACTSEAQELQARCDFYIYGLLDGMLLAESNKNLLELIPSKVTKGQLLKIVKKTMEENPEMLHEHMAVIAKFAVLTSFYKPPKK